MAMAGGAGLWITLCKRSWRHGGGVKLTQSDRMRFNTSAGSAPAAGCCRAPTRWPAPPRRAAAGRGCRRPRPPPPPRPPPAAPPAPHPTSAASMTQYCSCLNCGGSTNALEPTGQSSAIPFAPRRRWRFRLEIVEKTKTCPSRARAAPLLCVTPGMRAGQGGGAADGYVSRDALPVLDFGEIVRTCEAGDGSCRWGPKSRPANRGLFCKTRNQNRVLSAKTPDRGY